MKRHPTWYKRPDWFAVLGISRWYDGHDTGTGTLDYSESVYGLVRAFRIAGARNVLMSLRKLNDISTREFMVRFYRTWLNGSKPKDLAVALRETQLSFIKNENAQFRDPNVWAPFVLIEGQTP